MLSLRMSFGFRQAALRSMRKLDRQVAERVKATRGKSCGMPRGRSVPDACRDARRPAGPGCLGHRILYTVDDDGLVIVVVDAGHRGVIYR